METRPIKIIIAGASGYIGKAIIPKLLEKYPHSEITALSRSHQKSDDPRVTWKVCELFSLKSLEKALPPQADLALYLVHSMVPTAHLDQGCFADYDLLLADNFARSIQKLQIQHLIYLGGLIPKSLPLSLHLQSRLEMEETFGQYHLPLTIFRAALILGEGGSSFQILLKLVQRLPIMICPRWTQNLTTPVDLPTVLTAIVTSALDLKHLGRVYDLAGCEPITYLNMMRDTAKEMRAREIENTGKKSIKRYFLTVPFFTPTLSRLWVRLITQSPKNLVYPLIESLEHAMIARDSNLFFPNSTKRKYSEIIKTTSLTLLPGRSIFHFQPKRRTVRSVQRLPLPPGKDAEWAKNQFAQWLPRFFSSMIKVTREENRVNFSIFRKAWVMLQLQLSSDRSDPDRQLLYITQGRLVAENNQGRLEFRVVLNRRYLIAAIHDYVPSLPWFIYKYTQAALHLYVMKAFGQALPRLALPLLANEKNQHDS